MGKKFGPDKGGAGEEDQEQERVERRETQQDHNKTVHALKRNLTLCPASAQICHESSSFPFLLI